MAREHWNDVPGDIAGGDAEDLPGGFGSYDPDRSPEAMVDELFNNDVIGITGTEFTPQDQQGGDTSGTPYTDAVDTGSTIDPNELIAGEEAHPGAGVGFTGAENEKLIPPELLQTGESPGENPPLGGTSDEPYTHQQQEDMSVETEVPTRGRSIRPPRGKKAA